MSKKAFAFAAHPDDIEFMMSGTLMLLGEAGYELHYMNIANGSCGSLVMSPEEAIRIRAEEGREAAKFIGAVFHESLVNDIEVFYDRPTLARVGAIMREVNPEILLLPSPQDYMEDHTNASRLGVTAAFCKGMPNWPTEPPVPAVQGQCAVYHALPYGLCDGLRGSVKAGQYVDVSSVMEKKRAMLACHRSQKEWLDKSQGLDAYLETLTEMCAKVGSMSGCFDYAEGWRRRSHLGFGGPDFDPLGTVLGKLAIIEQEYESSLQ